MMEDGKLASMRGEKIRRGKIGGRSGQSSGNFFIWCDQQELPRRMEQSKCVRDLRAEYEQLRQPINPCAGCEWQRRGRRIAPPRRTPKSTLNFEL